MPKPATPPKAPTPRLRLIGDQFRYLMQERIDSTYGIMNLIHAIAVVVDKEQCESLTSSDLYAILELARIAEDRTARLASALDPIFFLEVPGVAV